MVRQVARAESTPPVSPRRVRRAPEEARQHILAAAATVMAARGPDAVGLKDVARAAGVSHALVCHYFGTYDALVTEVLRAHLASFRAALIERIASPAALRPEEWLGRLIDEFTNEAQSRVILWALLSGRLEAADAFPRKDQGLRQLADAVAARLASTGRAAPKRARIESVLVTAVATAWGYLLGRHILWMSAGREPTAALDASVREHVVALVVRELGLSESDAGARGARVRRGRAGAPRPPRAGSG